MKQSEESKQKSKDRAEYSAFRHQASALKEFADEKRKIPKLQKDNKAIVKVVITIDSVDNDEVKTLTGYITQQIGDNSVNAYELTFDRVAKKITAVKKTGDGEDPEAKEPKENTTVKKGAAAPDAKKAVHKKSKEDEEDDEEEEKTPPSKEKDED